MVNDLTNRVVELQKTMEDVKSKPCRFEHVAGASVQIMHCSIPVRNAWEFKRLNEKLEDETFYEQMVTYIVHNFLTSSCISLLQRGREQLGIAYVR